MSYDMEKVIGQVWLHKPVEVRDWACAFVEAGLACLGKGQVCFAADDVPEGSRNVSPSIPGIACRSLMAGSVVAKTGGMRKSKAPSAHGRPVYVYKLTSLAAAEHWLSKVKPMYRPRQGELWEKIA